MTETLEYKILKYLSENDNGIYIDISFLSENKNLMLEKVRELKKLEYLTFYPTTRLASSVPSPTPKCKIQLAGKKFLSEIELKNDNVINHFNNSTIGQFNQSDELSVLKTEMKQMIQPKEKEKQQNAIAESIGKWFWQIVIPLLIGIVLLAIQQKWFI